MLRALLGVIAGVAASSLLIALVESIGHGMFPPPEGLDPHADPEGFARAVEQLPVGALAVVLLAWAMGTFFGSWLATRIVGRLFYGMLVGGIMMLAGIANIIAIPHPLWFSVAGMVLFLPCAWAGARLAAHGE